MYSQRCNLVPDKKQSAFAESMSFSKNLSRLRNLTTKSFSKFDESSTHISVDYKSTFKSQNNFNPVSRVTSMMDFIWNFNGSSKMKLRNSALNLPTYNEKQKHNCKEIIAQYEGSSMPMMSCHLVGGFVGSKSQLGRRPANGFGVKMWDIIRELSVFLVKPPSSMPSLDKTQNNLVIDTEGTNVCTENGKQFSQLITSRPKVSDDKHKETESNSKQSYADVTKSKLPVMKENLSDILVDQNSLQNNYSSGDCNKSICLMEPLPSSKSSSSNRDRICSECSVDSEDSFIVFDYSEGDDYSVDDCSSSSDDDDDDILDLNEDSSSDSDSADTVFGVDENCTSTKKKVRFAEGKSMVQVHPMVTWNYAYRTARRGPWEMLARDSERFRSRIANTGVILKPILDPQHRESVFQQRFAAPDN